MKILDRHQLFNSISLEQKIMLSVCSPSELHAQIIPVSQYERIDWDELISLCERHRLLPLFYKNFQKSTPSALVPEMLKRKVGIQTQHALALTSEGLKINQTLAFNGIKALFLKGTFLSYQLYDDYGIRPSKDIDILVDYSRIDFVSSILLENGYRRIYPDFDLSHKQRNFYEKHKNQYAFKNINNGIVVELHWRLFSSKHILNIPFDDLHGNSELLTINNINLNVLNPTQNFHFLCFHGAVHQWYRLLWLRDIAQILVKDRNHLDLFAQTNYYGTERVVEQAVRLSKLFFDVSPNNYNFCNKNVISSIVQSSTKAILDSADSMNSRKISRFRLPIYKMKLKRGLLYKFNCWTILHPNFQEWKTYKIKDSLFFLYFLLRPFFWFKRVYLKRY